LEQGRDQEVADFGTAAQAPAAAGDSPVDIVIPMAGQGARFGDSGTVPKPLIEVEPGKRMIDYAIDYLRGVQPRRFFFVCRSEHVGAFGLRDLFAERVGPHTIVETAHPTRGPSSSVLLARPFIDGDRELLVAYSDTFLTIDVGQFLAACRAASADGGVLTYPSVNPAFSYARVDGNGLVKATAEKIQISRFATADLYYFRRGRDFVAAARRMEARGRSAQGEFFVSPVYNEMIEDGARILAYPIAPGEEVVLGTPEDLSRFRQRQVGSGDEFCINA
jgi:dTDP-glucose pyrophosphorylase